MERMTEWSYLAGIMTGDLKAGVDERKAFDRLAAYEDFMERWRLRNIEEADRIFQRVNALGGTDLMAQYRDLGPIDHLRELAQAKKDGRLVALPPVSEDSGAFQKNLDVFELSIAIKWAHDAALMDENPEVSHLFLLSEIALNEKLKRLVSGQSISDQLTREEAEAALKKREVNNEAN